MVFDSTKQISTSVNGRQGEPTMDMAGIREINEQVEKEAVFIDDLLSEIRKTMVG